MNAPSDRPSPAEPEAASPPATAEAENGTNSKVVHEVFGEHEIPPDQPTVTEKVTTLLVGKPLDLDDRRVYQHVSLIAFFAWVGLGADGLSSSCYGPAEAFEHLEGHSYLAIFLALATMLTVFVISACYSQIIAVFPSGGGGYLVASKMLGPKVGALSGSALIIDYVLTVTVSIAAAGDATFGLLGATGAAWQPIKLLMESLAIFGLVCLNLRGVKESITFLMPIFVTFLITHALMIVGVLAMHFGDFGVLAGNIQTNFVADLRNPALGWFALLGMFLKAYSLGAGTYTGIEAVSNSMSLMREPRVATAQRTMLYMAVSLAIAAGGLMLSYLLFELDIRAHGAAQFGVDLPADARSLNGLQEQTGQTMNDLLAKWFSLSLLPAPLAAIFRWVTILAEATLLLVAAQAGFIGGPKCLANMAHDSWVPHWFGSLSERLTSQKGIILIGLSSWLFLIATGAHVSALLVMYSINVFATFTLSMLGMIFHWHQHRGKHPAWRSRMVMVVFGFIMCLAILLIIVSLSISAGAGTTVVMAVLVTGGLWVTTLLIRTYYRHVTARLKGLDETLGTLEVPGPPNLTSPDPEQHTAVILVGGYSGLGVHTLLNAVKFVPKHFKNMIFISVGVVDSGNFKGVEELEGLRKHVEGSLSRYVDLARKLGFPSTSYMSIGADVVEELEQLCRVVYRDFPKSVVFAGQLVFQKETWYGALLHNQTAYSLQRRLQWDGVPMVILPTRVREA
jgi:amino acid transporter